MKFQVCAIKIFTSWNVMCLMTQHLWYRNYECLIFKTFDRCPSSEKSQCCLEQACPSNVVDQCDLGSYITSIHSYFSVPDNIEAASLSISFSLCFTLVGLRSLNDSIQFDKILTLHAISYLFNQTNILPNTGQHVT